MVSRIPSLKLLIFTKFLTRVPIRNQFFIAALMAEVGQGSLVLSNINNQLQ